LTSILNRFFALTNYAVAVCPISEQYQDRGDVLTGASECIAHRTTLNSADSTAAVREFLIACCD
jgi:hypothetical protein